MMKQYLLALGWVLMVTSCSSHLAGEKGQPDEAVMASLKGEVTYLERMLLPADAEVRVTLEDVSLQDVAATILAETSFQPTGAPPYRFSLDYDPAAIREGRQYHVRARITAEKQLMFISTRAIPAFATDPVEILVSRVSRQSQARQPDVPLVNTRWSLITLDGKPANDFEKASEIHLTLLETARGFAGCNRYTGGYTVDASRLSLDRLAVTQLACAEGMAAEQQFLQALSETDRYEISGPILSLFDASRLLAQFEATYLN